tara:strand:- start:3459 stop:3896 length:438 start_codon:yes stop_codon:yes gene_type:complete
MKDRQEKWDARFLEMAEMVSTWSKDQAHKVGAVIVDEERRVLSMGYNGFPRGVDDDWRRYHDKNTKRMLVVHAELNAILTARTAFGASTLYITSPPCCECAKAIIQAGIIRVVWSDDEHLSAHWAESCAAARTMFDEAGIDVEIL